MRLRTVIFGVYVLSSAVGLAVLMAIMLWEVRPRYVESMRRTMEESAHLMSVLLEARLRAHPELETSRGGTAGPEISVLWKEELSALQKAAGRMRVYVTDHRGIVIGDSAGGRDIGSDYTRRPEMEAYFRQVYKDDQGTDLVNGELRVSVPVIISERTVAFVGVGRQLNTVQQFILRARIRLGVEALVIAAIMVLTGWWISNRIAASIEKLTRYAQEARHNAAARPPVSLATEITELGNAFETLRRELEGKEHVEHFTQALAHEVKAPLSAIRGAAELLAEDPPPEDRDRFLANLRNEAERLRQIVDRLLQLASLEARRGRHETRPMELGSIVRESLASLATTAALRRVSLRLDNATPVVVPGEAFLLRTAVDNLLSNALEFSPPGTCIQVSVTWGPDGAALLQVLDEGPGIPDYALPRLFERFYSLPRPDTGRKSSGLGLKLVREVATLHGGTITVENRTPSGTRAVLVLPSSPGEAA